MSSAAIPIVMVLMVLLFGGKKKTGGKKDGGKKDSDKPDYEEGDREKRPADKKKKTPGTDIDDDLPDGDYDPDFFDGECGPGWVLVGDECVWLSDYEAPNVPADGLWIAPDCGAVVVGKDWWEEVCVPLIAEAVEAGAGYNLRHHFTAAEIESGAYEGGYDWLDTYEGVAYMILAPYDMGPVNDATGERDTSESCLEVFPMFDPIFDWWEQWPQLEDYLDSPIGFGDMPAAYVADTDAWRARRSAYQNEIDEVWPGLAALFTAVAMAVYNAADEFGNETPGGYG